MFSIISKVLIVLKIIITSPLLIAWTNFNSQPVTTPQAAAELGAKVAHSLYSEIFDFEETPVVQVENNDEEWRVFFTSLPTEPIDLGNGFQRCVVRLGGGPEIGIRKADGKIIRYELLK